MFSSTLMPRRQRRWWNIIMRWRSSSVMDGTFQSRKSCLGGKSRDRISSTVNLTLTSHLDAWKRTPCYRRRRRRSTKRRATSSDRLCPFLRSHVCIFLVPHKTYKHSWKSSPGTQRNRTVLIEEEDGKFYTQTSKNSDFSDRRQSLFASLAVLST